MFKQVLYAHWKASHLVLLPLSVAAFALPLYSARDFSVAAFQSITPWSPAFPLLALAGGLFVAAAAWSWDQIGKHVYAMSLPLPSWKYAMLKMAAGGVSLALPVVAFGVGALVATMATTLPVGVQAYPFSLTARFASALLMAYGFSFALLTGKAGHQIAILVVLVGLVMAAALLPGLGLGIPGLSGVFYLLVEWPGPFGVFNGSWMLFNV